MLKPFAKLAIIAALTFNTILPASADQLYVRNHPFKGAVVHEGAATWVELKALAAALEAKLTSSEEGGFQLSRSGVEPSPVPAGKVAIGDEVIDARETDGKILVSLEDTARLLGLKIIPNHSLGTVDVNFATGPIANVAPAPPAGKRTPNPAALPAQAVWLTSYTEAVSQSQRTGKPIMMDFTGSNWCGWCKKLKAEVFETPDFKKWAAQNVVLLELDYPRGIPQSEAIKKQNTELAQKFQIQGYPTILFTDAGGKVLGQYGYDEGGPAVWTKKAGQMIGAR